MVCKTTALALSAVMFAWVHPLSAQTDSDRLEKLERAVEQLQKRNAELEGEVHNLKKKLAAAPEYDANGNQKPKTTSDGKAMLEKSVIDEKPPVFIVQRGPEIKLTLGGFIQANFEDGDVSAFEGRFGQTALRDRFRLRRARINLTGDYAEQFDFK
ncbi:MAG TPA: bZIP transcription factor, partial [Chthoniobacterales bacterium]|nr:bZIP transcription factor [Chthoniobacterales bacterium]